MKRHLFWFGEILYTKENAYRNLLASRSHSNKDKISPYGITKKKNR
jgi:hypothetical protein